MATYANIIDPDSVRRPTTGRLSVDSDGRLVCAKTTDTKNPCMPTASAGNVPWCYGTCEVLLNDSDDRFNTYMRFHPLCTNYRYSKTNIPDYSKLTFAQSVAYNEEGMKTSQSNNDGDFSVSTSYRGKWKEDLSRADVTGTSQILSSLETIYSSFVSLIDAAKQHAAVAPLSAVVTGGGSVSGDLESHMQFNFTGSPYVKMTGTTFAMDVDDFSGVFDTSSSQAVFYFPLHKTYAKVRFDYSGIGRVGDSTLGQQVQCRFTFRVYQVNVTPNTYPTESGVSMPLTEVTTFSTPYFSASAGEFSGTLGEKKIQLGDSRMVVIQVVPEWKLPTAAAVRGAATLLYNLAGEPDIPTGTVFDDDGSRSFYGSVTFEPKLSVLMDKVGA